jgi:hypothetical protein
MIERPEPPGFGVQRQKMKPLVRGLTLLLLLVVPASADLTAQSKKPAADPAQQAEITALIAAVDDLTGGKSIESSLPVKWEQEHFLKAEAGKTYVPFTLAIDPPALAPSGPAGVYVRAVKKGSAVPAAPPPAMKKDKNAPPPSPYAFDQIIFVNPEPVVTGQPQRIRRALAVEPGDYEIYVAVRGAATPATAAPAQPTTPAEASGAPSGAANASSVLLGAFKHELTVPDFEGTDLKVSSVIVATKVDVLATPLPPDRQSDSPYTFQELKVTPSTDYKFTTAGNIGIIFWIYGAGVDPATKKPNLKVDFSFNHKLPDGEKPFKRTDPQELNPSTLPAEFTLHPGDPLRTGMEIELATFPAGEYHLEVKVADNVANKTVSRDVNFTVAAQ